MSRRSLRASLSYLPPCTERCAVAREAPLSELCANVRKPGTVFEVFRLLDEMLGRRWELVGVPLNGTDMLAHVAAVEGGLVDMPGDLVPYGPLRHKRFDYVTQVLVDKKVIVVNPKLVRAGLDQVPVFLASWATIAALLAVCLAASLRSSVPPRLDSGKAVRLAFAWLDQSAPTLRPASMTLAWALAVRLFSSLYHSRVKSGMLRRSMTTNPIYVHKAKECVKSEFALMLRDRQYIPAGPTTFDAEAMFGLAVIPYSEYQTRMFLATGKNPSATRIPRK